MLSGGGFPGDSGARRARSCARWVGRGRPESKTSCVFLRTSPNSETAMTLRSHLIARSATLLIRSQDSLLSVTETAPRTATLDDFVQRVRSGDVRALARAISAIEDDSAQASRLMKVLFRHSGRATVIGLTGSPGAGKSTLVDQLAREYRKQEKTIGIIAVDPTSPYTGGAILGDRIRMQAHHADNGIYIRSMATRGFLGGLAPATADVATLLDAAGKHIVLIETVGVGQDEIDIVRLADVTVVILVPGMGDDVQTIKAGIMEIADIFVINKVDHDGAERVEREIRAMQSLAIRADQWTPPIVKTVATDGRGIQELADAITAYESHHQKLGLTSQRKVQNWEVRLLEMLRDTLLKQARAALPDHELSHLAAQVAEHKRDPYSAVEEIARRIRDS